MRAPSAYEAAAEILANYVEVLVVDLSLLGRRHQKLLEIARDMETHVLAVGSTREQAPVLSGIRLAAWDEVSGMLRQLAMALQEIPEAPPVPAVVEEPLPGEYEPAEIPVPPVTLAPAKKPQATNPPGDPKIAGQRPADPPQSIPAPQRHAPNVTPEKLLTADELEALLRDQS